MNNTTLHLCFDRVRVYRNSAVYRAEHLLDFDRSIPDGDFGDLGHDTPEAR